MPETHALNSADPRSDTIRDRGPRGFQFNHRFLVRTQESTNAHTLELSTDPKRMLCQALRSKRAHGHHITISASMGLCTQAPPKQASSQHQSIHLYGGDYGNDNIRVPTYGSDYGRILLSEDKTMQEEMNIDSIRYFVILIL